MLRPIVVFSLLSGTLSAATITNAVDGVGPNGSVKPYLCVQNQSGQVTLKLASGQSGDANKASGNEYYVGATLRFGGCDLSNTYLGYVGFNLSNSGNNSIASYSPPEDVHIVYNKPAIDSQGRVTGSINYTAIATNSQLTQAQTPNFWQFAGFNLSGLEFSKVIDPVVIPNLSIEDSSGRYSDLKETEEWISMGMNTTRVPISWSYLQLDGPGKGRLNLAYYNNYIRPLLQSLTQAKVHTIIDLHAYMRYSKFGEQYSGCGQSGPCPDGTLVLDDNAYKSVWGQLVTLIQNDPAINKSYILLDLMNEPVGVPDDKVFAIQASLIKLLRDQKFDGYIMVEGNGWSGLHSWENYQWTGINGQTYSNATLFTRDNFAKAGITDLSKILINVHQYLDNDFSGTHDNCLQDLTTTGQSGFNLDAFVNYLQQNRLKAIVTEFGTGRDAKSCTAPLRQFMQYLQDNSAKGKDYGFVGWTIWSTGHGWGDYNLRVKPNSYQANVLKEFL
ncbi:glycoside hydrolase family 5 protein [Legionella hackeliae]|uniref:Putative Cellulase n=1 Tax=Legionella hackeliae TaxID=449 RepID=A0A0A8UTA2_LEGHA|nr:cellulase family glycosylhydrolase [Legionella hackeliae]KTD08890.1 Endoglucanase precursor [Legionella hackeliae]CEK10322.1 putative Cellulase [Legionella hackeliae]STX47051.1 Endoglucanase precursor [Legionella hackeliae]